MVAVALAWAALTPAASVAYGASADFGWQPAAPLAGQPTTLNVTTSTAGAVAVLWDLDADGVFDAIGPSVTTVFPTQGLHVVQLDVVSGGESTAVHTISVGPPTPPPPAPPPPAPPASIAAVPPATMVPFPVVRMQGLLVRGGIRVTRLAVHAPAGARIHVTCATRGHGCPRFPSDRISGSAAREVRMGKFERRYRAGAIVQVFVASDNAIGKYTSFRVRRRSTPFRRDLCIAPGGFTVTRCPGS